MINGRGTDLNSYHQTRTSPAIHSFIHHSQIPHFPFQTFSEPFQPAKERELFDRLVSRGLAIEQKKLTKAFNAADDEVRRAVATLRTISRDSEL
jgi:hypothetical protein